VYGYFGAHVGSYSSILDNGHLFEMALVIIPIFLLGFVVEKYRSYFKETITLYLIDLFLFLFLFLFLLYLSIDNLQQSLFSDEIAYAGNAHGHSMYISYWLVNKLNYFDVNEVEYRLLVQALSIFLMSLLAIYFLIIHRFRWVNKVVIITFSIILCRLVFFIKGGNGSPHPPLELFHLFIFGSLFGISSFSFKIAYFSIYVIVVFIIYKQASRIFSNYLSVFFAIAVGTFPLLLEMGSIVEHSIFGYFIFSIIMLELVTSNKRSYVRLIGLLSVGVLMRQPVVFALVPIMLINFKEILYGKKKNGGGDDYWIFYSLILLFIPFFVWSVIFGTPVTSGVSNNGEVEFLFLDAIETGVIVNSIMNVINIYWILMIPFAFIWIEKYKISTNYYFILFYIILIIVYYSISPGVWGFAKYQSEITAPFAVVGLFNLIRYGTNFISQVKFVPFLFILICLNIYDYFNKHDYNISNVYHFHVSVPYNYSAAYQFLQENGMSSRSFSMGPTYGVFPEVMNGYSIKNLVSVYRIYSELKGVSYGSNNLQESIDRIDRNKMVDAVLVGMIENNNKDSIVSMFESIGWRVHKRFFDKSNQVSVDLLVRNTYDLRSVSYKKIQ